MSKTENKSWDFLWYTLYAFAGLGLELLLLGLVEPVLFGGTTSGDYSDTQRNPALAINHPVLGRNDCAADTFF